MTFAHLIEGPNHEHSTIYQLRAAMRLTQVGWIGHATGAFYPWDEPPYGIEPGGFTPCYIKDDEHPSPQITRSG